MFIVTEYAALMGRLWEKLGYVEIWNWSDEWNAAFIFWILSAKIHFLITGVF